MCNSNSVKIAVTEPKNSGKIFFTLQAGEVDKMRHRTPCVLKTGSALTGIGLKEAKYCREGNSDTKLLVKI